MKKLPSFAAIVIIIVAVFLVYWPALRNGFVWDDTALCFRDPLIRSWLLIPEGFCHFLFLDATPSNFYRPLQRLTFTADYQLYSFAHPWGWHLTSIALHAAAAVALWALLRRLSGAVGKSAVSGESRDRLALGVAVVWAIHPLHTSAITYIAGRADPLAAFCGFSALTLGLISLERTRRGWLASACAAVCFLGALLSKESGAAALLVWFLILAWRRESWRVFAKWLALAALVVGSYSALRFSAQHTPPPAPPPTPVAIRPILAARAVTEYAGLLIAPLALHMERDVSTQPQATVEATLDNAREREFQTLLGVLLVIAFGAWWRHGQRRDAHIGLALGAFVLAYLPISNVFPLNATVAEHWLYVPSAFLFLAAALSLRSFLEKKVGSGGVIRGAHRRLPIALALGIWVVFLGVCTFLRQADWRDQRAFLESTIAAGGDTPRMHMNLGNLESGAGHHERALAQYREALQRAPGQPIIWLGYAHVLLRARDFEAALAALAHAESAPLLAAECARVHAVLAHLETGSDSGNLLRDALDLAPDDWSIRRHYVEYLIERGDDEEAMREMRDVIQFDGFRNETWKLMGQILESIQRPDLALGAYRQAAARDVHDDKTRQRIGQLAALGGKGK